MYSSFYTAMTAFLLLIWIEIYILLPQGRRSMFWTSWSFASGGPISEYWFRSDYWHPPYLVDFFVGNWHFGMEDYFAAFALIGISVAIFEVLALRKGLPGIPAINGKTYLKLKMCGIICIVLILTGFFARLNSMTATFIAFTILIIAMQLNRVKIFQLSMIAAGIFTLFYWAFCYVFFTFIFPNAIETYWKIENTWGIMI